MKAAGKFKTYKEDKLEQFSGVAKKSKQSKDRLKEDKQFLSRLTDVQTLFPSKKFKERRVHKEAKEVLEFLEGRKSFWSQMEMWKKSYVNILMTYSNAVRPCPFSKK